MKRFLIGLSMLLTLSSVAWCQEPGKCEQQLQAVQKELDETQRTIQFIILPRWFNDLKGQVALSDRLQAATPTKAPVPTGKAAE